MRRALINVTPTTLRERAAWRAVRDFPPLSLICAAKHVMPVEHIELTEGAAIRFRGMTQSDMEERKLLVERLIGKPLVQRQSLDQSGSGRSRGGPIRRAWWFD